MLNTSFKGLTIQSGPNFQIDAFEIKFSSEFRTVSSKSIEKFEIDAPLIHAGEKSNKALGDRFAKCKQCLVEGNREIFRIQLQKIKKKKKVFVYKNVKTINKVQVKQED